MKHFQVRGLPSIAFMFYGSTEHLFNEAPPGLLAFSESSDLANTTVCVVLIIDHRADELPRMVADARVLPRLSALITTRQQGLAITLTEIILQTHLR